MTQNSPTLNRQKLFTNTRTQCVKLKYLDWQVRPVFTLIDYLQMALQCQNMLILPMHYIL